MNSASQRIYERYAELRPNYIAPSKLSDLVANDYVFRRCFSPFLPKAKDAAILDVGCGYGEFLCFLQRLGYAKTRGIDLDPRHVQVAAALGVANVQCGDVFDILRSARGEFHFISALDVLEHIPKPELLQLLDLIYSALSSGGRFLCQVPNLAAFYNPIFYMDISHETPFTGPSLRQILRLAGFGNVTVLPRGPLVHGAKSAMRYVLWKGISASLRFVSSIEGGPRDRLNSIYTAAILAIAEKD